MRRFAFGGLALSAIMAVVYAALFAPRWLQVVRLRVALPGLPDAWSGVRIAHLSDFHAGGAGVSLAMLQRARQAALDFQPELLAITGDFYDDGVPCATDGLYHDWPSDLPVVAVLGNHDFRGGDAHLARVLHELDEAGVQLLRNEARAVPLRGRDAWVVGVDDPHTWRADDERAFATLPPAETALLYLAHSPAAAKTLPVGRVRLMLSGHTHGGQLRLRRAGNVPFVTQIRRLLREPPRNDPHLHEGAHWTRGAVLLISSGLGVSRLPLRVRTRPQVFLIELERAAEHADIACDDVRRYVRDLAPEHRLLRWLS